MIREAPDYETAMMRGLPLRPTAADVLAQARVVAESFDYEVDGYGTDAQREIRYCDLEEVERLHGLLARFDRNGGGA